MNKLIVIFVLLNVINIYYQFECSDYRDSICGGYNSYKLKCHKFGVNDCEGIEVDDGCTIDSSNTCVAESDETLRENERCFNYGSQNKCRRIKHQCTSYKDSTCGGLVGIEGHTQCIQLSANEFCSQIEIDDYCEVSRGACSKKAGLSAETDFEDNKHFCTFNQDNTSCKKQNRVCSEQTNCGDYVPSNGKICSKVEGESTCKEIQIDESCTVNELGKCVDQGPLEDNEICDFNPLKTICQPRDKVCNEYLSGSTNCGEISASSGKRCSKVNGEINCKEIQVKSLCKIDDDGNCVDDGAEGQNKICFFDDDNTICQPRPKVCSDQDISQCNDFPLTNGNTCSKVIEEDECKEVKIFEHCKIDPSDNDCKVEDEEDRDHTCYFNSDNSQCIYREKVCSDYTSSEECEGIEGCSYFSTTCKEVTVGPNCKVERGVCSDTDTPDGNTKCLFDYEQKICEKRREICSNYFTNNCENVAITDNSQCVKFSDLNYCKEIEVNENCNVESDSCIARVGVDIPVTQKCAFINEETRTSCK